MGSTCSTLWKWLAVHLMEQLGSAGFSSLPTMTGFYSRIDGRIHFGYPPEQETARITLNEARYCHLAAIRCDFLIERRITVPGDCNEDGRRMWGVSGLRLEGERVNESVQAFLQDVGHHLAGRSVAVIHTPGLRSGAATGASAGGRQRRLNSVRIGARQQVL